MIVKPDFCREQRCGVPEVVFGESKSVEDLLEVLGKFMSGRLSKVIITRLSDEKAKALMSKLPKKKYFMEYSRKAGVLVVRKERLKKTVESVHGVVGVLTAGTADVRVAEEARIILEELGCKVICEYDVGVAGIHRVFPALEKMKEADILIVVAGMEGALPSVVSGLVDKIVVGVPTSVGYGTGRGGEAALNTMLNSCTPIAVVNIDNGYGAAVLAYKIAKDKTTGK